MPSGPDDESLEHVESRAEVGFVGRVTRRVVVGPSHILFRRLRVFIGRKRRGDLRQSRMGGRDPRVPEHIGVEIVHRHLLGLEGIRIDLQEL